MDANRPAEAEPLFRRALGIDEASHSPDHLVVAIRLKNLQGRSRSWTVESNRSRAEGDT
jgi:hypothetical protein